MKCRRSPQPVVRRRNGDSRGCPGISNGSEPPGDGFRVRMRQVSLLFHDVYRADPRESGFVSAAADRYKLQLRDFDAQLASLRRLALRENSCGANLVGFASEFQITVDD